MRRIGLEMLIGFVGVYAAFALSAYKERRDLTDRRHQVKRALIRELQPLVENARRNAGAYGTMLASFDSSVKAGKKPIPHAFIEPLGLGMHVFEATKQAGGMNLIDVPTFVRLSDFYNAWSEAAVFYGQLRDLSVNVILPNVDRGPDAFYDARTGALRPEVRRLYYYDLGALDNLSRTMVKEGTALIGELARDTI
jgi:hypothetical protein